MTFPLDHNRPPLIDPDLLDREKTRVRDFADAAGAWLDKGKLESDEDAGKLKDFIDGARGVVKQIDAARTEAKKPHDDAAKAVQAAFKPLLDTIENAIARTKPMLTVYLEEKRLAEEARRAEAARIAREEAQRAAEAAAAAQARHDVMGEAEAAAALEAAQAAEKAAQREFKVGIASASGGGRTAALRGQKVATIVNIRQAFLAVQDDPAVVEAVLSAVHRKIRAKDWPDDKAVPGVTIQIQRSAA
jgi:hypothetical protein